MSYQPLFVYIPHLVLCIIIISFVLKICCIAFICYKTMRCSSVHRALYYLVAAIFFSLFSDIAWIVKLFHKIMMPYSSYILVTFFIRIGWASIALQHQYLALFMQQLTQKKNMLSWLQYIVTGIGYCFCVYFIYIALFKGTLTSKESQLLAQQLLHNAPLEVIMVRLVSVYLAVVLIVPGLCIIVRHVRPSRVPKILKKQLFLFIICFIFPYLIIELLQALAITFSIMEQELYCIVGLAALLLMITMYYALNHVLNLRFMNWSDHVLRVSHKQHAVLFHKTVEQLSKIQTVYEARHITQQFFSTSFDIKLESIMLYVPQEGNLVNYHNKPDDAINALIAFIMGAGVDYMYQHRILAYDDIAFNHFYKSSPITKELIKNLDAIDADIFLPLYYKNYVRAVIVVKKNGRTHAHFYSKAELDEMLIFANYVSSSINLIYKKNTDLLTKRIQETVHKLYVAHQEVALFKESIHSFMRTAQQSSVGLLFYQHNFFTYGNQYAQELFDVSLNYHKGHPLVKQIAGMAQQVMRTHTADILFINHMVNKQLITVFGSMRLDKHAVLLTFCYATVAHVIRMYDSLLHHPGDWHYLLLLQTTVLGAYINSYLPIFSEYILNCKIHILKSLLNPQTLLIHAHEDDIDALISFVNYAHGNKRIHTISIDMKEDRHQSAYVLFGNRSLESSHCQYYGLLEKIDDGDIVVIKNVHCMHQEGQQKLATFIELGWFSPFYDDTIKKQSKVRIVVTVSGFLPHMLNRNMLDKNFYLCTKANRLIVSAPNTWPFDECMLLIEEIIRRIVVDNPLGFMVTITDKNKKSLYEQADSVYTLYKKIQILMNKKIDKVHVKQRASYAVVTDTDMDTLACIGQLGKKVLQDFDKMRLLWHVFHNQHAIARFLGVHASSIYKQCKKYNLH